MNITYPKNVDFQSMFSKFHFPSIIAILLILFTVLLNAWIGDDARIIFRQIWNLFSGDGITFNFEQRVQAFSNPLWFWTLTIVGFFSQELFLTTILVSLILTISSTILLAKTEHILDTRKIALISPIILLSFSWAFIDYSTSGLENCLSYFLTSLLCYFVARGNFRKDLQKIFFIISLLCLNRLDYTILFLPLSLYLMWFNGNFKLILRAIWPGLLLIFCWFLFATYYFGFPLPNTYYAKLNTGYPNEEVLLRGWNYFISMRSDLNSVIIIIVATVLSTLSRNKVLISITIGQLLYMLYIFQAGGDFMLGRFFAILVLLSVGQIILSLGFINGWRSKTKNLIVVSILIIVSIVGIFQRFPFLFSPENIESRSPHYDFRSVDFQIVDEKAYFYYELGLFSPIRESWTIIEPQSQIKPLKYFVTCGGLGIASISDPSYQYIDQCALTDPFLARIPAVHTRIWRIGHHFRKIPTEYGEYLLGNVTEIPDKNIISLLKDMTLITYGKLNDFNRFSAIWRVNTGYYSKINFAEYIDTNIWIPITNKVQIYNVNNWNNTLRYIFFNGIVSIQSEKPTLATSISVILNWGYEYELYINDMYVQNIRQEPEDVAKIIEFAEPTMINSIKFEAIDSVYLDIPVLKELTILRE